MPKTKERTTPFEDSVKQPDIVPPKYTKEEEQYYVFLKKRLDTARKNRENNHDEFNRRSYTDRYLDNMQKGYTLIAPLQNESDTQVDTGTIRHKVENIVSAILNLNFIGEIRAYDKEDIQDEIIGSSMTDMITKSERLEDWDKKKVLAYWEMVVQGDVFIEELWVDETRFDKKKIALSKITNDTFKNFDPEKKIKEVFSGCRRNIIAGPQFYVGNITEPTIENQPYIFIRDEISYEQAKAIYGDWPRFKNVPKDIKSYENDAWWALDKGLAEDMVEIIKYQDKWNDEFQILLNGIMMLPVGFPMPWEYGEYNTGRGQLEPNHSFFFYGKGIVEKSKFEQETLNEMFRLMILNTQKSFMPPIANLTGDNLGQNDFMPGKVLNDIDPTKIGIVGGPYGVTQAQLSVVDYIRGIIDDKSIKEILSGASPEGRQTATEITALMNQAKQSLGLIIAGFINLHRTLSMLRLYNILENWTKPISNKYDEVSKKVTSKYRSISLEKQLPGKGRGVKEIRFTENLRTSPEIMAEQMGVQYAPEKRPETIFDLGKPIGKKPITRQTEIVEIDPKALRNTKYNWFVEVTPQERDTSLVAKAEFEQSLINALNIWGPQIAQNPDVQERWARFNKFNPESFFKGVQASMEQAGGQAGMAPPAGMPSNARITPPAPPSINNANMADLMR